MSHCTRYLGSCGSWLGLKCSVTGFQTYPIGSMYGIYANIGGILMVNVTIYGIHGSYGYDIMYEFEEITSHVPPTSSPYHSSHTMR